MNEEKEKNEDLTEQTDEQLKKTGKATTKTVRKNI